MTMVAQLVVDLVAARQRAKARRAVRDMMIAEQRARAENEVLRREWLERVLRQQQHGARLDAPARCAMFAGRNTMRSTIDGSEPWAPLT
jgi:hypothetical protein